MLRRQSVFDDPGLLRTMLRRWLGCGMAVSLLQSLTAPAANTAPAERRATHPDGASLLIRSVELHDDSIVLAVRIGNQGDREIRLNAAHSFVIGDDARGVHRLNPPADNPELRIPAKVETGGELVFIGPLAPSARQLTVSSNDGIGTPDNPHDDTPVLRAIIPAPEAAPAGGVQTSHPDGTSLRVSRVTAGAGGCVVALSATNGNERTVHLAEHGALELLDDKGSAVAVETPAENRDLAIPPGSRLAATLPAACRSLNTSGVLTLAANRGTGGTADNPFDASPLMMVQVRPQAAGDIPGGATAQIAPIARSHLAGSTMAANSPTAATAPTPPAAPQPASPPVAAAPATPPPRAKPSSQAPPTAASPAAPEEGRAVQLKAALRAETDDGTVRVTLPADDLFGPTGDTLTPQADASLTQLGELIKASQPREVLVTGHTDSNGSDEDKQALSDHRAKTVGAWLTQHAGKRPPRFVEKGYGRTRPVAPNHNPDGSDNPDGRAKNRRIEITLRR